MVRKMRQYCRFNFNFHADDIRISSCLKNEIKFFSLVDILQEINKKDPQYIFFYTGLNNLLMEPPSTLRWIYKRAMKDLTSPRLIQCFPSSCQVKFTLCFLSVTASKETLMECILTRHPCHHKCDQTVCLISAWKNQKHIILLHRPIYSACGLSIVLISIYFTFLWM